MVVLSLTTWGEQQRKLAKAAKKKKIKQESGDANETDKYYGPHEKMIGRISPKNRGAWETVDCISCEGKGTKRFQTCNMCSGQGKISVPKEK